MSYVSEVLADSPACYWRLGEARNLTLGFACGFECATLGVDWAALGSGTSAFDTTIAGRSGARACKIPIANSTATNYIQNWTGGNEDAAVVRLRFRFSALPTSDTSIFAFNGRTYYNSYIVVDTAGVLAFDNGGTRVEGPTIVVDQWYTLQFAVDGANKVGHWSVDGVVQTDPGAPANVEQFNAILIGKWNAVATGAFDLYVDDIVVSYTFADYPLVDGSVTGPPNTSEHWSIADNAEGTAAYDGTYVNAPTLGVAGLIPRDADTAVTFSRASTQKVDIAAMPAGGASGVAIEALFRLASTSPTNNYEVFSWGPNGTAGFHELSIQRYDASGTLFYWLFSDGSSRQGFLYTDNANILDDVAYHLVGSFDYSTKVVSFYLNGSLLGTKDFSAYGAPVAPAAGLSARIAGYMGNDLSDLNGTLDEVAVYLAPLSAARVAAHAAALSDAGITMARRGMVA